MIQLKQPHKKPRFPLTTGRIEHGTLEHPSARRTPYYPICYTCSWHSPPLLVSVATNCLNREGLEPKGQRKPWCHHSAIVGLEFPYCFPFRIDYLVTHCDGDWRFNVNWLQNSDSMRLPLGEHWFLQSPANQHICISAQTHCMRMQLDPSL